MFVDDLKIYAKSQDELQRSVEVAERTAEAVGMTFGIAKCSVAHMRRGRVVRQGGMRLQSGGTMKEVNEAYKYLGVSQLFGPNLKETKSRIKKEFIARLRRSWEAKTNTKNKVHCCLLQYLGSGGPLIFLWGSRMEQMRNVKTRCQNSMSKSEAH